MIIDGLILATLLLSALIAFFRGFVREVLTLFGLAGALAAAYFGAPLLQPIAHDLVGSGPDDRLFGLIPMSVAADVGAFAFVFLAVLILLTLTAHAISHGLHAVGLGSLDRTLGVLFGLLRGVVLVLLFYMPFYFTAAVSEKEKWFEASATLPLVDELAQIVEPYLPNRDEDKPQKRDERPEKAEDAQGFERLDGLMRQALEPGEEPDVVPARKTGNDEPPPLEETPGESKGAGYDETQNDALDAVIKKETE